jgi:antitoxin component YwqK of YwqJK toxin-antitoxin module
MLSCGQERKVNTYYDDGTLYESYFITQDSVRDGQYLRFAQNGDTLEKSEYALGRLNGKRILYYDNNVVEIIETYLGDSLEGLYKVYYEDGSLQMEMTYNNNKLNSLIKKYYPSGEIMEEVTFKNNEENGPFVEYYKNGNKKWEGTYESGDHEIGLLVQFAENGDTLKKMMCDDRHICRTIWENPRYKSID